MATIKGNYWTFYLEGRGEKRLLKNDIADDELVARMVDSGAPLRDVLAEACAKAAVPLETSKRKRTWLEDHNDEIQEAGGDTQAAYAAYLQGRVDELAYALEERVLTALGDRFGAEEEEEEEEEEDEDEEA